MVANIIRQIAGPHQMMVANVIRQIAHVWRAERSLMSPQIGRCVMRPRGIDAQLHKPPDEQSQVTLLLKQFAAVRATQPPLPITVMSLIILAALLPESQAYLAVAPTWQADKGSCSMTTFTPRHAAVKLEVGVCRQHVSVTHTASVNK